MKLLRPSVLGKTSIYRRRFLRAKPFRHLVIRNAFDPKQISRLCEHLEKEKLRNDRRRLYRNRYLNLPDAKSSWLQAWHRQASRKDFPEKVAREIPHRFNSLILFEIHPKSLHKIETLRTDKRRLTVSGWFFHKDYDQLLITRFKHSQRK